MNFEKITVCLDMYGCPNRCKHCWLGITPNGNLSIDDLKFVVEQFRPFTENLEVSDRYREEDYKDNYKELWRITTELSDSKNPHFENISYWRAVRDNEYVPWLYLLGVKAAQLTIFGDETTTDNFVGREGAFQEIMQTIEILIQYGIAPRIQTFINKNNIAQLPYIQSLIESLNLEKRCSDFVSPFAFFLHQGSCDGENEQFYDVWLAADDIDKIPQKLIEFTLKHFGKTNICDVLGDPEKTLYNQLILDNSTENIVTNKPIFFIDKDFNVYPNYETPSSFWCLGNLKFDGAKEVMQNYVNNNTIAQNIKNTIPINKMVVEQGNPDSMRLFGKWDYKNYILNKYCRAL